MSALLTSLGNHALWGFSSAFNFLSTIENVIDNSEETPLSVLLVDPGDLRHILESVCKRRRQNLPLSRPIHIYLIAPSAEAICRHLILLDIILDTDIPIRQRANTFLELYGNIKLQNKTEKLVDQKAKHLINFVTKGLGRLATIVDLSQLKYKDKDNMENVFKSYSTNNRLDVDTLFDHRLRGYYTDRYDSRNEVADWDYHYSLRPTAASIIHIRQFKDWRATGLAFEFNDQLYTEPNRTMASYSEGFVKRGKEKGLKKEVQGYWSDVVASPYVNYGIDSETNDEFSRGLFEIVNKDTGTEQHRHNTVEIAVYSLLSLLWEMETGVQYAMTRAHDIFSGLGSNGNASDSKDETTTGSAPMLSDPIQYVNIDASNRVIELEEHTDANCKDSQNSTLPTNRDTCDLSINEPHVVSQYVYDTWRNIKIIPLLGEAEKELDKSKYHKHFDFAFISFRAVSVFESQSQSSYGPLLLTSLMKPESRVAVETAKYIPHFTNKQKDAYINGVLAMADKQQLRQIEAPVQRRRRDDRDWMQDVLFFDKI